MKKYAKKSLFTLLALSLICTMFNISVLTQNVSAAETDILNVDGLELSKKATDNGDGTYNLQLEAYAEGEVKVVAKSKPLDIVLVLDQSGSMEDGINVLTDYFPTYNKAIGTENTVITSEIYYVKTETGQYITVSYDRRETLYDHGFIGLDIWKTAEGNDVVPTNEDGSVVDPSKKFQEVQFYKLRTIHTGDKKIDILKRVVRSFTESVISDGGDHRIAVVGYANGDKRDNVSIAYQNTELFIGNKQYSKNGEYVEGGLGESGTGNQITGIEEMYAQAFQSVKDASGNKNIEETIKALTAKGATRADLGMDMAYNVLVNDPNKSEDREKVVLMFTDGQPTESDKFSEKVANTTIEWANKMKAAGAKVFTVGVEDTLDVNADPSKDETNDMNRYMQYVSSNYPNAKSLTDAGTDGNYQGKKFLSANDEASLLQVFEDIREEISSSSVTLDKTTKMVDYISNYFEVTNEDEIKIFTQKYKGKNDFKEHMWDEELIPFSEGKIQFVPSEQKISVTGFDYSKEFIAENPDTKEPRGRRLVLQIKVKVKDGFIGGQDVPTNKNTSGIYDGDDNPVENFIVPEVNEELNFAVTAQDKSVYVATKTGLTEDVFDADSETNGVQYILNNKKYDFDGINNAFVDILYKLKIDESVVTTYLVKAGEKKGTWSDEEAMTSFENNTPFTVEAELFHKNKKVVAMQNSAEAQINVFKPVVTVKDEIVFKGEKVDLNQNIEKIDWVCTNTEAPKPSYAKPEISYGFTGKTPIINTGEHLMDETTLYTVSVRNKIEALIDYTGYTTFENENTHDNGQFKITVVEGELQIIKHIESQYTDKEELNSEQSFKFKIERSDEKNGKAKETYYQTIQFSANEGEKTKSLILKGLSKGYYTVTEMNDWSWKYDEDASKREDNYSGNGNVVGKSENSLIYIGDNDPENTGGKLYFGATSTIVNNVDYTNPAITNFYGDINQNYTIGDVASAINKFTTKK